MKRILLPILLIFSGSSTAEFLNDQTKLNMEQSMFIGKDIYERACMACHQENGKGIEGVFPSLVKTPITTGSKSKNAHIHIVANGVPDSSMLAFSKLYRNYQLAAVITYERNAWGNNTGDIIQPSEVADLIRKSQNEK